MTDLSPAATAGTITLADDLTVNRMGYGAMRITGDGVWGPPADRDGAVAVLRRAVELGVDFVDTADSYGPDVSEELIAEAYGDSADRPVIATKAGLLRDGPNLWRPDGRPEHLRAACEGSLRRLGVEQIDLYQFHRPDPAVPFEDSVGTLVELQAEGKIRHIGLSNVDVDEVRRAASITPIVSVQNRYNVDDRSSDPVVDLADELGFAFIPWAPVGGRGLRGSAVAKVAERHSVSPMQVGLAWLLARSPQVLPIPGTKSVPHLEENVAAAAVELTDADLEDLATPPRRTRSARQIAGQVKRRLTR